MMEHLVPAFHATSIPIDGPSKPTLRKNFPEVHSDRADLYVYFYGRALQLLGNGGMLAFISSNKWFRAGYGKKLRKLMTGTTHVTSITDFGDLPVFESATAYPMIFTAQKERNKDGTTCLHADREPGPTLPRCGCACPRAGSLFATRCPGRLRLEPDR